MDSIRETRTTIVLLQTPDARRPAAAPSGPAAAPGWVTGQDDDEPAHTEQKGGMSAGEDDGSFGFVKAFSDSPESFFGGEFQKVIKV
eukprot:SAG31_NODE_4197_length_3483_cov_1.755319_6_plen_86_part_01